MSAARVCMEKVLSRTITLARGAEPHRQTCKVIELLRQQPGTTQSMRKLDSHTLDLDRPEALGDTILVGRSRISSSADFRLAH